MAAKRTDKKALPSKPSQSKNSKAEKKAGAKGSSPKSAAPKSAPAKGAPKAKPSRDAKAPPAGKAGATSAKSASQSSKASTSKGEMTKSAKTASPTKLESKPKIDLKQGGKKSSKSAAAAPASAPEPQKPVKKGLQVPVAPKAAQAATKVDKKAKPVAKEAARSFTSVPPRAEPPRTTKRRGADVTLVPARGPSPTSAPVTKTKGASLMLVRRPSDRPSSIPAGPALPIPVRKVEAPPTLEERFARIEKRLGSDEGFRRDFYFMLDQAWVSHDSALEGTVYTRDEIQAGFGVDTMVSDSSLQPAADEIRRHREALDYIREFASDPALRKQDITLDVIKKIYLILHPSEGDLKTVKYRKDIPQHRLYFHEYTAPDKIAPKVRQIVDWLNEPETKKSKNIVRIAARAHYDLLRVFPFQTDSGKVARLFMNLLLYRAGHPPAVIHAKERQGYYEALKGEPNRILRIVQDAVEDGLSSIEKLFQEQDARKRPGA